jgi:hypothetical protein
MNFIQITLNINIKFLIFFFQKNSIENNKDFY